jgi:arsenite-transporting ATPase
LASGTKDPLLRERLVVESKQIDRVERTLARKTFIVPWQASPPVGLPALERLAG